MSISLREVATVNTYFSAIKISEHYIKMYDFYITKYRICVNTYIKSLSRRHLLYAYFNFISIN